MLSQKTLDQISAAIRSVLPQQLTHDVRKNMNAALQSALERLDLVTREELEVQEAVLEIGRASCRERV